MVFWWVIGPTWPPEGFQLGAGRKRFFLLVFGLAGLRKLLELSWKSLGGPRKVQGLISTDFGSILGEF
eukprot:3748639-Karenia_brevis.AAC.1